MCEIWGFHSGAGKNAAVLESDAVKNAMPSL